jgi:hypothetical protein
MSASRKSHYDELGVHRNAIPTEIERAWRNYRAEADHPSAVPDRLRENRVKAAYETLSDPVKRAAYDDSLLAAQPRDRSRGARIVLAGVLVLGVIAAAAFFMQPPAAPPPGGLATEELTHNASQAMARVRSVDMTGKSTTLGLAFAIEQGVVATACEGISPLSQLSLQMTGREVLVKVAQVDERLGLCKLTAKDIGSWPLTVSGSQPASGARVYATKMNAVGEVGLVEARVKHVVASARGETLELSVAVLPERNGGPVLDARGHVVGFQRVPTGASAGEVVRLKPDDVKGTPPGGSR